MARKGRRQFTRYLGKRPYKKLFVISAGGGKTEPQYFNLLNLKQSVVRIECLKKGTDYSPRAVIKKINHRLVETGFKSSDEAWLVVDLDEWTEDQLIELYKWSKERANRGFALSNPKFEFWLLLHFEDGRGVSSSRHCTERLKKYIPGFDKGIDLRLFPMEAVKTAVQRAKSRDVPRCEDWPRTTGTTVYRLIERIFDAEERYSGS